MPRIATSLLRRAKKIDRFLPPLLGVTRDLDAAANELRWLREHADAVALRRNSRRKSNNQVDKNALLRNLVKQRARGMPLQYLLGTEFFGDLELKVRKGVLIPRQDTANAVTHLAHLIRNPRNKLPLELRLLDLCTGSGCIPLLFGHELLHTRRDVDYRMLGVDISPIALELAQENLARLRRLPSRSNMFNTPSEKIGDENQEESSRQEDQGQGKAETRGKVAAHFLQADILRSPFIPGYRNYNTPALETALNLERHPYLWDIIISNPPYISPAAYWKTTMRSVRGFEPRLALVPPDLPLKATPDIFIHNHSDSSKHVGNLAGLIPIPIPFRGSIFDSSIWASDPSTIVPDELPDTDTSDTKLQQGERQSDQFYHAILAFANRAEAKVVLLEVADEEQAVRVVRLIKTLAYDGIEIWREQLDAFPQSACTDEKPEENSSRVENSASGIPIIGTGNMRSVVCWRGVGAAWLGREKD